MLGFALRCGLGAVVGAAVAWIGIAEHRSWVYVAGVGVAAAAVAALAWHGWTRWRGEGLGCWLAAAGTGLVVVAPAIGLPWQAHRAEQPEQADWLIERAASEQHAIGDLLFTRVDSGWYVVDPRSGDVTADLPTRDGASLVVGPDAVTYEQRGQTVTAYDATGAPSWQRRGTVIAAAETTTVVRHCVILQWPKGACPVAGVDTATGQVRWRRDLITNDRTDRQQPVLPVASDSTADPPAVLPRVVVTRASRDPDDLSIVDPETGETTRRFRATDVGVSGDLVVGTTESDRGCVLRGYRDAQMTWETTPIPDGCPPAPLRLLESRLYVHLGADETLTVDLADGSWRRCGRVELELSEYDDDTRTGEGSDDVIVYRDGPGGVYGVDAGTGTQLWRLDVPGDQPAGLEVGHGAVAVLSEAETHNPFVPEDLADDGVLVTVLDARTGEVTGRWTGSDVQDLTTVAPGRAVVIAGDQMWPVGS